MLLNNFDVDAGYFEEKCFWRVFAVFPVCSQCASVSGCMVSGLISSVLDTWRIHCAVPTPEQGRPGRGVPSSTNRASRLSQFCNGSRSHATSFIWSG